MNALLPTVTKSNIDALLDAGLIQVHVGAGRWWQARRNGATKFWKRDPSRIRLPIKAGMYVYGVIDDTDFDGNVLCSANVRVLPSAAAIKPTLCSRLYVEALGA